MITRALLAVIVGLIALCGLQTLRLDNARLALAQETANAAAAQAAAQASARKVEQDRIAAADKAAAQYEQGKQDAQATADRVAADLRNGTLKLRREWATCETGRLSEGAEHARELAAANERRAELAGAAVRVGAVCDAYQAAVIAAWPGK